MTNYRQIDPSVLLQLQTPQERGFSGSTVKFDSDYFTPYLVQAFGVKEVNKMRSEIGYIPGMVFGAIAEVQPAWRGKGEVRMRLEELDETGATINDPRFVQGRWDEEGNLVAGTEIDRTEEMYISLARFGKELHLRTGEKEFREVGLRGPEGGF